MEKAAVKSDTSAAAVKAVANQPKSIRGEGGFTSDLPNIQFRFREKVTSVSPIIQPKLTIGQPNDKYEQEADKVADRVMTMPEPALIQRSCSACRDREIQTKPLFPTITPLLQRTQIKELSFAQRAVEDEEELVQTKVDTSGEHIADSSIEGSIDHTSGHGSALHSETRSFMESRFGADFSNVRIHNNSTSIQLNKELNAQAFTRGSEIYFNQGKYNPESSHGMHLLAHELTHVVQQTGAGNTGSSINTYRCNNPINQNKIQCTSEVPDETIPGLEPVTGETTPALGGQHPGIPGPETCEPPENMDCDGTVSSPETVDHLLTFPQDSAVINSAQLVQINAIARSAHSMGVEDIRIDGYASAEGACLYNWDLACRRAHAIANALISPSDGTPGVSASYIFIFAHGETNEFGPSLALNRQGTITLRPPEIPTPIPIPTPGPEPLPTETPEEDRRFQICGDWVQIARNLFGINQNEVSDFINCFCLGAGILDLVDSSPYLLPISPYIEGLDCLCNILSGVQVVISRGIRDNCWSPSNYTLGDLGDFVVLGLLDYADCASLPLGTALGSFIIGLFGAGAGTGVEPGGGTVVGGAGGLALGAMIGDFMIDIAAMALQNLIIQGTPLPVSQCESCVRLAQSLGLTGIPQTLCGSSPAGSGS